MTSVFLTGASGFIGKRLASVMSDDFYLRQAFRKQPKKEPLSDYVLCDFKENSNLSLILKDIDVVIHCAGRAHLLVDDVKNPSEEFRKINLNLALMLAREAVKADVKRFIFLSSIGVNGRSTTKPFLEDDLPSAEQDYAISKLDAENGLQEIALSSGMEVVIIRPPLVYGPNAPGNFGRLIKFMQGNILLPLGAIYNKRSFVALDNLVDLIVTCIDHPAAANEIFLVSDGEDLSTTELLTRISYYLGKKPWLLPINQNILKFCLMLIGKKDLSQRLCGSLQVDISKAKKLLGWTPPVSVDEALKSTAESFLKSKNK